MHGVHPRLVWSPTLVRRVKVALLNTSHANLLRRSARHYVTRPARRLRRSVSPEAQTASRNVLSHVDDLHASCRIVYHTRVGRVYRLNVTLDGEHAAKLSQLAKRSHVQEGTLARSLLSHALDEADPDARHVAELLDGIDGAFERAQLGLEQARAGQTVPLDEL